MATKKTTSTKKTAKPSSAKAKAATPKAPKAKKASMTKVEAPQAKAKKHREPKVAPEKAEKKLSQFQAAIKVLAEARGPLTCKAMVEAMEAKGYWSSPNGKTPSQTLYAAILRNIKKGKDARFVKENRGMFALASKK
jgi:hypothetical protein